MKITLHSLVLLFCLLCHGCYSGECRNVSISSSENGQGFDVSRMHFDSGFSKDSVVVYVNEEMVLTTQMTSSFTTSMTGIVLDFLDDAVVRWGLDTCVVAHRKDETKRIYRVKVKVEGKCFLFIVARKFKSYVVDKNGSKIEVVGLNRDFC